ncbi:MAG: DEAD/DEAH box helicase [Candidatus Omnitrophica bacterium]|nr:DEAD/DEAH box helicase [Candidatus Omnitrophota bacterium]
MSAKLNPNPNFSNLDLSEPVLKALNDVGYESPTPIQEEIIPLVLAGRDVMGQAQTGTGKTAAFALPLLTRIDLQKAKPQVLVLAPTRELAIQVAEAFKRYAMHLEGFHVLPIYGGQDYSIQLRQLKRGVHVVVGTPGRVMDHMRRGTLNLDEIRCLVLDEADEMLRMGFIEDVDWILDQTPSERQVALFSATIPGTIRKIAQKHLKDPASVTIKVRTSSPETIHQRFWLVSELNKLDALTRILEGESFDGMIVFVRTKTQTMELAEKLEARGYASAPLNGDIAQKHRERTIQQFKNGDLDILVATDVAARGLDVDRVSHVINYDVPYDAEAYIHRIGRTGRAGRDGEAILFIAPRERRMLRVIEKAAKQTIEKMTPPSTEDINNKRIARFKERITDALAVEGLGVYYQLVEQYCREFNVSPLEIAAALAQMANGGKPLLLEIKPEKEKKKSKDDSRSRKSQKFEDASSRPKKRKSKPEKGMDRYRIEVGQKHGVKHANIVGAIANEAGLDSKLIGRIDIYDAFSTVDLPEGMPRELLRILKKVWVSGQKLKIARLDENKNKPYVKKKKKAA